MKTATEVCTTCLQTQMHLRYSKTSFQPARQRLRLLHSAGCSMIQNDFIPNVTSTCSCFSCMCPLPPSCQREHTLDKEMSPQITQVWKTADRKYYNPFTDSLTVMTCLVILKFLCEGQKWANNQAKMKDNCPCNEAAICVLYFNHRCHYTHIHCQCSGCKQTLLQILPVWEKNNRRD